VGVNIKSMLCSYLQVFVNLQLLALNIQEIVDLLIIDLHIGHPNEKLAILGLPNHNIKHKNGLLGSEGNHGIKPKGRNRGGRAVGMKHLARGVEDVADGAWDDARVGVGAVHGERLAAAGLPVGEGRPVEPIDSGANERADDRRVDPLVRRRPVEHVVCRTNRAGRRGSGRGGRRGEERRG
jgi:hypothetical protein